MEDFLAFDDHEDKASLERTHDGGLKEEIVSDLEIGSKGVAGGSIQLKLRKLLGKWSRQAPSRALDPVTTWTTVLAHRHDCFRAVEVSASAGLSPVSLAWYGYISER